MPLIKNTLFFLTLAFLFALPAQAATLVPQAPKLDADSYILMDAKSGEILAQKNADKQLEPASMTKIMTAFVVFNALEKGRISLDDKVTISEKAWRMKGSRMFIEVGKEITVKNLLKGMIVQSGNDASVALAEYIAGTEGAFANLMNQYAQQLGMTNTHFENSTGMPAEGHLTTAHDLAILSAALIREFPELYDMFSIQDFTWNNIHQSNRNGLLYRDPSVDGLKTGHTQAAGYCLAASAKRDNMRLVSVVMGTDSSGDRVDASQALLNWGFRFFETHQLYSAGEALTDTRIWKGETDTVALGLRNDLYVTIPYGTYKNLKAYMNVATEITAPVGTQKALGVVEVTLNGKPVAQRKLYALEPVAEGGLWRQMVDSVLLLFE